MAYYRYRPRTLIKEFKEVKRILLSNKLDSRGLEWHTKEQEKRVKILSSALLRLLEIGYINDNIELQLSIFYQLLLQWGCSVKSLNKIYKEKHTIPKSLGRVETLIEEIVHNIDGEISCLDKIDQICSENKLISNFVRNSFEPKLVSNHTKQKIVDIITKSIQFDRNQQISDYPLYSFGYANCNGIALLGKRFSALSHYSLETRPENYLDELILILRREPYFEGDQLAIIVGGDLAHFKRNVNILKKLRIPIVGGFLDLWDDKDEFPDLLHHRQIYYKSVLVIPQTRGVYIGLFTRECTYPHEDILVHNIGFMRLFP